MIMRIFTLLTLFLALTSFKAEDDHKFYVSTTIVAENTRTQSVEITIKVFTDDLELALEERNNLDGQINLGEEDENEEAGRMIESYVRDSFTMTFDGRELNWAYIGSETEYDLTYIYFEITPTPRFSALDISNKILLDQYDEQVNITHIQFSGWEQTLYFDKQIPEKVITR